LKSDKAGFGLPFFYAERRANKNAGRRGAGPPQSHVGRLDTARHFRQTGQLPPIGVIAGA